MVEHELAVGVGLQVAGDGADQAVALPQREVLRLPAPVVAQAAVGFQSGQEGVADERVAAVVQRIPVGGGNGLQGVEETGGEHGGRIGQVGFDCLQWQSCGRKKYEIARYVTPFRSARFSVWIALISGR